MLRNRIPEIEIPESEPFKNDKLNRSSCAEIFCSLVKLYSTTGCVIALQGEWGTGKTTFVRMLMQKMKNEGGHPLYFNAWENDYLSDPIIALLSELKDLCPQSSKWDNVIKNGGKILTAVATSAAKAFARNKLGVDSDILESGMNEASIILKKDIDAYTTQKTTFVEFQRSLKEYVADNTTDNYPVVFFIDELDRCNPCFAVLVLERIKHLFDIPNIIFVLSINKKQLGHAIQGYYGSANIDAENYLRRFIDIEYSLPKPNGEDFCQYFYDTYNFDEIFNHKDRLKYPEFRSNADSFLYMAKILISSSKLDIRTTDKIFAHTRLALMEFGRNSYIVPDVYFLLCYLKIANSKLYRDIVDGKYNAQALLDELEKFFSEILHSMDVNDSSYNEMIYAIASFVLMYTISGNGSERERVISSDGNKTCSLKTKYLDSKAFTEALLWYYDKRLYRMIPLTLLIQKIELEKAIVPLA